ncbi:MAG: uroporphyrinogen-III C-methyltransferase [Methylococcales symbiont of Hymedesmia sp. n. MRB-2018]|nr:MAG: uroporphyrinogen-III C-methyltransferase [Methylococcales symbiont of Hymedesmia sp. n. MRB-2018]KAF3983174.1 MAG: uroporphyrinogen-III C-methyltransferase [Methylococcales symbiont of Hymedesmia sp. n. MRB-2018]
MDYFPLFIKLKKRNCLVVGAGGIAARKIELLSRAGAIVTVIAKQVSPAVKAMEHTHQLIIKEKSFAQTDVTGFQLIVSATNDSTTNSLVSASATKLNIPVNVVDNPDLCSFIFPAIIDRSPIIAAVSSGGSSPVLARLLRAKIESIIPPAFGQLAKLAEKFRQAVKQHIIEPSQRRIFWEQVLQGRIAELVFSGKISEAEKQLELLLSQTEPVDNKGEVYLVGAGPGDPDLLTFRALRLMQQADVVIYDRLVSPEILDLTRRDSEKIYVGKQRKNHSLPQHSINQLLATLAKQGKRVVRLKGGDPFIFGRGGEEIETLVEEGVAFQIVPGITAASGCATYAGIPLTHRDHAQSCTFVTGQRKDNSINLNWSQLSAANQTIVFYMGLSVLDKICQSLIQHGCPKNHPIAIIQQGTTPNQRVITGILESFPKQVADEGIKAPTLIIVGTVVSLHNKLEWFKTESFN